MQCKRLLFTFITKEPTHSSSGLQKKRSVCPVIPDNNACVDGTSIDSLAFAVAGDITLAEADGAGINASHCDFVNGFEKTVWYDSSV